MIAIAEKEVGIIYQLKRGGGFKKEVGKIKSLATDSLPWLEVEARWSKVAVEINRSIKLGKHFPHIVSLGEGKGGKIVPRAVTGTTKADLDCIVNMLMVLSKGKLTALRLTKSGPKPLGPKHSDR